ncbi:MAG: hypothetical protein IJD13_04480 [Oscillospiraceae bacterium]|nr:hypothetical protein [Oscillospiraceae bacterium]
MLLHTILDPLAVMEQPAAPVCACRNEDPFCISEWTGSGNEKRLRRIISTDLSRYLDPRMQPGSFFIR